MGLFRKVKKAPARKAKVPAKARTRQPLRPTPAQVKRARALAITRDIVPGTVSTRAERDAAIQRVMASVTRARAAELIREMATRQPAHAWVERTPEFKAAHARRVARLLNRPAPSDYYGLAAYRRRYGWPSVCHPQVMGPLTRDDAALADAILGHRPKRETKAELRAWHDSRVTRHDDVFGEVLVGEW